MGTLATSVNESLVFDDFPEAGESPESLGQDADQHAGAGQVQTNQEQDKEAETIVPQIQYSELTDF